uniref:Magnesium transporter MgtE intracellular domain-containing protein n=1 Tax=Tetradesmus obliquus TaxID=3088 RepID=A0A383WLP4_TETOB|eukprot:jgi/Sobl393_1/11303/SZX78331.1
MHPAGIKWIVISLVSLWLSGGEAQGCNPAEAAGLLPSVDASLTDKISLLGCKAPPSVNLVAVMGKLTSTLGSLPLEQLQQLPQVTELAIARPPAQLKPFFSLSGKELGTLMPLVQGVPADSLKVVMPLLAQQQPATVARMLSFLKGVSSSQLQQLSPLFASISQHQVNLLATALNTLPGRLLEKLSFLVGGLGPVQSVAVASPQQQQGDAGGATLRTVGLTMTPVFTLGQHKLGKLGGIGFGGGSSITTSSSRTGLFRQSHVSKIGGIGLGGGLLRGSGGLLGRLLLQDAAAAAAGCDPVKGLEVGAELLSSADLGAAVCKFTPEKLAPVMGRLLDVLNKQSSATLASLPAFADLLATTQPEVLMAIARIPRPTLAALLSVEGADSSVVVAQLKTLAAQDAETLNKLVYFTGNVPADKLGMLVDLFASLSDRQAATMSRLLNSLSAGQMVLALQLLEKFNFGVDNIQSSIPAASSRGSSFNIGPFVRVTVGGSSARGVGVGGLRLGLLG